MRQAGVMALGVAALCATMAGPAQARTAKHVPQAQLALGAALPGDAPPGDGVAITAAGRTIVHSGLLSLPAGLQVRGSVKCPGTKVPLSGGAYIASSALVANINSTFPKGRKWIVDANNGGFSATTFTVYAICGKKPKGYHVVTGPTRTHPTGSVVAGDVQCPNPEVALGGGMASSSANTASWINTSEYLVTAVLGAWHNEDANNTGATTSFVPFVVCAARPPGFSVGFTTVSSPSFRQTSATRACPSGSLFGGGAGYQYGYADLNINSTYPLDARTWRVWGNNSIDSAADLRVWTICGT